MPDKSVLSLGGTCAILNSILLPLFVISFLFSPERHFIGTAAYFETIATNPRWIMIRFVVEALYSLLAIAVVIAISDIMRPANEGLVRWMSILAILGYATLVVDTMMLLDHLPRLATRFVDADEYTKAAILAMGSNYVHFSIDPDAWVGFGLPNLWFLMVGWLAIRGGQLPKNLALLGLIVGGLNFLAVAGDSFELQIILNILAVLGGLVVGPIWFIWVGITLRRLTVLGGTLMEASIVEEYRNTSESLNF
jgi:hypothetical protein